MKGTSLRNEALADLFPILWYGQVDSAITFLRSLPNTSLKKPDDIQGLIGYLERNRPYIPCKEVDKYNKLKKYYKGKIGERDINRIIDESQYVMN